MYNDRNLKENRSSQCPGTKKASFGNKNKSNFYSKVQGRGVTQVDFRLQTVLQCKNISGCLKIKICPDPDRIIFETECHELKHGNRLTASIPILWYHQNWSVQRDYMNKGKLLFL